MKSPLSFSLALIAAVGIILGPAGLSAQERAKPAANDTADSVAKPVSPTPLIRDVALGVNQSFTGHILDRQGKPIDGAQVSLIKDGKSLANQTSDRQGKFVFSNLRGGVYDVQTPVGVSTCRLWTADTAPPKAKEELVIADGSPAVRAQFGFLDPANTVLLLLGVAGVTLSAIAVADINEVEKKVDKGFQSP